VKEHDGAGFDLGFQHVHRGGVIGVVDPIERYDVP
jgi:hypothetical protein